MDFSQVLYRLKDGSAVARESWNGRGQFVYLVPGGDFAAQTEVAKKKFGDTVPYLPYLALCTVSGWVATWVPSITDLLATDWVVCET